MNKNKKIGLLALFVGVAFLVALLTAGCAPGEDKVIKIGTQNYAEVITCAYMAKALIEEQTDYKVEVIPRLGGAVVVEQALRSEEIDIGSLVWTGGGGGYT